MHSAKKQQTIITGSPQISRYDTNLQWPISAVNESQTYIFVRRVKTKYFYMNPRV